MKYDTMIQSVQKALGILNLFSISTPRLGVAGISQALGIHKATAQGLVKTLQKEGFLEQDTVTKKYKLGLKIYELGVVLAASLAINQKCAGPAHRLSLKTGLLIRVCILDGHTAITTLDVYSRTQPFLVRQLGVRFPLYCTAMGKVLLAFFSPAELDDYLAKVELFPFTPNTIADKESLLKELEQVRQIGYSVNREEHVLARAAIGVPIFDALGRVSASASLVGDPGRVLGEEKESLARMVVSMAAEISGDMGYYPEPIGKVGQHKIKMNGLQTTG